MNSRILLCLSEKPLHDYYVSRRSKEIVINSTVLFVARVLLIIGTAIATAVN